MMSQVLLPAEVAEAVQVTSATVMRWLRSGKLRDRKGPGRLWTIHTNDLNAFLTDTGRPPFPCASIERQLTVDQPVEGVQLTVDQPVEGVQLTTEPLASGTLETVIIRQGPRPWSSHSPHRRSQQ